MEETIAKLAEIRNADDIELSELLYSNFIEFYSK